MELERKAEKTAIGALETAHKEEVGFRVWALHLLVGASSFPAPVSAAIS